MTHRIIIPLDHSSIAESVLPFAHRLVEQIGASVTLLSVLDVPSSFAYHVRGGDRPEPAQVPTSEHREPLPQSPYGAWTGWTSNEPSAKQIDEIARETSDAEKYLKGIAETFGDTHVETLVRYGHPAERILNTAEQRDNSVIVLASHGRSGIGRALIGSVASRVVQAATVPVFVQRAADSREASGDVPEIRKVIVPVDGSAFSEQALPALENILGAEKTEVHLISVIETPRFANKAQSQGYVAWLAEQIAQSGFAVTHSVTEGTPSREVNRAANAQGADMIAMTTHGRSGLDRFVLGSVAERILHESTLPILLIRPNK